MSVTEFEFSILYFFQQLHTPFLDRAVPVITSLGDQGRAFILLGIVLCCFKKTRYTGAAILISLAVGAVIGNLCLKNWIMRDRPCWIDQTVPLLIKSPEDYSFPSGHTLAAFETAMSIFLVNRKWGIPMFLLAAVIALSRLYLFVHFPTDVLSGMVLGVFIAWYVSRIIEKYRKYAILRLSKT